MRPPRGCRRRRGSIVVVMMLGVYRRFVSWLYYFIIVSTRLTFFVAQDWDDCQVGAGCLFNCLDSFVVNRDVCDMSGKCITSTVTVAQPFKTGS